MALIDIITRAELDALITRVAALEARPANPGPAEPPPATPPKAYPLITEPFGRRLVNDGAYFVQNNAWGTDKPQAVQPRDSGFTLTRADGSIAFGGAPKSYPAIVVGEHYGEGSTKDTLPTRVRDLGQPRTSARITTVPGAWNAAYDIWVNSTAASPRENDDTEIMIWMNTSADKPTPIGSPQGKLAVEGALYTVWVGKGSSMDVISYVRDERATQWDIPLRPFIDESVRRGLTSPANFLTSVQFGFEPWREGAGLAVDGFTYRP